MRLLFRLSAAVLLSACVAAEPPLSEPSIPIDPPTDPAAPRPPDQLPESPAWPVVWVNEVLPGNDSVSMDEALDFDDWVELYNPGDEPVELDGWGLADDLNSPDWTFPDGTVIEPGEHLIVWLDDEPDEGPLHATFRVRTAGDEVALFTPWDTVADHLSWRGGRDDVVFGRFPSGGAHRSASIRATPGNANPVDPGVSRDPSDGMFPQDRVIRMDLIMRPEEEQALYDNRNAYVEASLAYEGAYLDKVQMHIKGRLGSGRGFHQKASFKLNLDKFVPNQRLRGLEHIILNNMVQDPSAIHESLAYRLFRDAGVPGCRTAYVELYINAEYRGLYLHVETHDDQFLKRWFDDPHGNLYEGTYGVDLKRSDRYDMGLDEQGSNDVRDRSDLLQIYDLLEQEPSDDLMPQWDRVFDSERVLKMLAGEVVSAHWDGYYYSANNYRIYHNPTANNWTLIPWGTDATFESGRSTYNAGGDIAEWCLEVPECKRRFDLALVEMAERAMSLECRDFVEETLERNDPYYRADTYAETPLGEMRREARLSGAWCYDYSMDILDELFPKGIPGL